jgi:8-oxo-dGTP pyrophosphatase MutT (NUDIX family)
VRDFGAIASWQPKITKPLLKSQSPNGNLLATDYDFRPRDRRMLSSSRTIRQAAALIVHRGRVCLVTASSGRRWIIPKGTLESSQTGPECAAVEAWEEAGIRGRAASRPLTKYAATKAGRPSVVAVYRLKVNRIEQNWPERDLRLRRWVSVAKAVEAIDVPEIRDVLRAWKPRKRKSRPRVEHAR